MRTVCLFFAGASLPLFSGYALMAWIENRTAVFSRVERGILAYGLGTGMLTVYMLGLAILGYSFSLIHFFPYLFFFLLVCLCRLQRGRPVFFRKTLPEKQEKTESAPLSLPRKAALGVVLALLAFKLLFVLSHCLYVPTYFDDAFTHWNYRAKLIFYDRGLSLDPESDTFLGGTHKKNYPLYIQLFKAYIMLVLGGWSESAAKFLSALYAFLLLALVYINLGRARSRYIPLLSVYCIASVPLFLIHAASNYADLTISFFFTGSGIYLCRWFASGKGPHFIVSALMLGVANLTKNEGFALYTPSLLLTLVVFLVFSGGKSLDTLKKIGAYSGTFLVLDAAWIFLKWKFSLGLDESGKGLRLEFHPEAFRLLYEKLPFEGEYNLFWIGLLVVIIFGWKILRQPPLRYNFFLVGSALVLSLLPFILTHNFLFLLNEETIHRTLLIVIPFTLYSCGLVLDRLFQEGTGPMKRTGIFALAILGFIFFTPSAFAEVAGNTSLTVLYTGNTLEEIKPCGCSREADFGGLPRRGTVVKRIRKREKNVLLLDTGDSLKGENAQGRLKARLLAASLARLRYDAILPGEKDFKYGPDFFNGLNFQGWVASNFVYSRAAFRKIIIKDYPGGMRVGIMGVTDNALFSSHMGISAIPPRKFLRIRLSGLIRRNRVNFPILLAHVPGNLARKIFREFREIKIIIAGHTDDPDNEAPQAPVIDKDRGLFFADNRARRMGEIRVAIGGNRTLDHRWVPLDDTIPDDPRLRPLFAQYKQRVKRLFLKAGPEKKKIRDATPFISAGQCAPCHQAIVDAWKKTRHAGALRRLQSAEQSFDPECVPCHVAGYGHGGFISEEVTPDLGGVQCESCHGPGRGHRSSPGEEYGRATRDTCLKCHTRARDPRFSFEEAWEKIRH